jgi:hypothetical protein
MATITQTKQVEQIQNARLIWLRDHRGVLAGIAKKLNVSHGKVRLVFHGATRSTDGDVEAELAKVGAPGFVAEKRKS